MKTGKLLIGSTLVLVIVLMMGSMNYAGTLAMSFADTSMIYQILRGIVAILLVSLLVTNPPRSLYLRGFIGVWSIVLGYLAIHDLLAYQLRPLDAVIFMEVAIIFAIEALEGKSVLASHRRSIPVSQRHSRPKKVEVLVS